MDCSSSSSSSRQKMPTNLSPHQQTPEEVEQLSPAIASSSSSSRQMAYQVFLSFKGEDTRHNFTSHLLKALKDKGINVFFDHERGGELLPALCQAIEDSIISVIVLSKHYASSELCLEKLSHIMNRKHVEKHVVLPIFYHVDPSDVRHIGGSFKASFDGHEQKTLPDQVQKWEKAFREIGKLKGWHIEGGKFDRSETEYIRDIVEDVTTKLNSKSRSVSKGLVGIDDQKETILRLIEQNENRVIIGLWGMAGIGKTTLAEAVYYEMSQKFDAGCFVQNVREKIEKKDMESLRDELLSILLKSIIRIDTPSIGSTFTQQRLEHKKVIVVLDDVDDADHIAGMGIEHFGPGSKIIVTCRDKQVLTIARADIIHKVEKLNEKDSLQLFSKFAFKQLDPAIQFRDLSNKFLEYAEGNPLALKVLGSQLVEKSRECWESELEKLGECSKPRLLKILQRSFDGLDELEKKMFLDIAVFFKWEPKDTLEAILSSRYKGAKSGIENLIDKCLIEVTSIEEISMHDMFEDMGKDIARNGNDEKGKRLWNPQQVGEVLRNNQTNLIEGINLDLDVFGEKTKRDDMGEIIDNLRRLHPAVLEKMHNLKYIDFHCWAIYLNPGFRVLADMYKKLFNAVEGDDDDDIHLPFSDELRFLRWHCCPYTSLSSSFNPKNLVVLNLSCGDFEQLWSEDVDLVVVNLREFDVSDCKNLRKIPNLLRAEKLKILRLKGCSSLVELPCLNHLASLDPRLELDGCSNLKKFPELPNHISFLSLAFSGIEEVPDSIEHLVRLKMLVMAGSQVKKVSSNMSKLESLHRLDLRGCPITEFPEISRSSTRLDLSFTPIRKLQCNIPLSDLETCRCEGLELLPENSTVLRRMDAGGIKSPFTDQMFQIAPLVYSTRRAFVMMFANCFSLNQDSVDYIVADAMFKIERLAEEWTRTNAQPERREILYLPPHAYVEIYSPFFSTQRELVYCFPSNLYSANKFKNRSVDSSIGLKISPNAGGGSRFLAFYIFVVVDFTNTHKKWISSACTCEYKLKTIGGSDHENFKSVWHLRYDGGIHPDIGPWKCEGNHVLILFSEKMIQKDKNYEKAYFRIRFYSKDHEMEVKHCGVNVYYVDEEPSSSTQT